MRAAIYVRTYAGDPAPIEMSEQAEICRAYADEQGYKVVGLMVERKSRGFTGLMERVRAGDVDVVLVDRPSRLDPLDIWGYLIALCAQLAGKEVPIRSAIGTIDYQPDALQLANDVAAMSVPGRDNVDIMAQFASNNRKGAT